MSEDFKTTQEDTDIMTAAQQAVENAITKEQAIMEWMAVNREQARKRNKAKYRDQWSTR